MSEVTERHNAPGTFTVNLSENLPADIRRQLHLTAYDDTSKGYSWLVVTPQRVEPADFPAPASPSTTPHPLLDVARYTGVLLETADRRTQLSGAGLLYLLGRDESNGPIEGDFADMAATDTAANLVEWLIDGGSKPNVLAAGTIAVSPSHLRAGTIHAAGPTMTIGDQLKTTRRWLSDISGVAGRRSYRVRPTGELDWGTRTELWSIFPRVVVGRLPASDDPQWVTVRTQAVWSESVAEFAEKALTDPPGAGGHLATAGSIVDAFVSPGRLDDLQLQTQIAAEPGELPGDWDTRAQEILDAAASNQSVIASEDLTGEITPNTALEPGEPIYLWDPEAGLVDPTNTIIYAGEEIHPIARYLAAVTWPIVEGMGVYLLWVDRSFGNVQRILDLTEYVEFNTNPEARLEVGAPAPTL